MISFNKVQSVSDDLADDSTVNRIGFNEKPDYVKKIESFDVNNLTPENIDFMMGTIQGFFREQFPVKDEDIDDMANSVVILDKNDFKEKLAECGAPEEDLKYLTGFYDEEEDLIYITPSRQKSAPDFFATMFHECAHFVSIRNDAGFSGEDFRHHERSLADPEKRMMIAKGLHTICEGMTQLITIRSVVYTMGFDLTPGMDSYIAEREVMDTIIKPFGDDRSLDAYFNVPMEDLRLGIERVLEDDDTRSCIDHNVTNGTFADCLAKIGEMTEVVQEEIENWNKTGEANDVYRDLRYMVGNFIERAAKADGEELDEDFKAEFSNYFDTKEENV